MRTLSKLILTIAIIVTVATFSRTVLADQIDGNWCFSDGRTFSIQGSSIVTPSGNTITGNYDRHAFSYVVPDLKPNAGVMVAMRQLNQMTINVTQETAPGSGTTSPVQIWKRCTPTTS
jgi:hypothetical protein